MLDDKLAPVPHNTYKCLVSVGWAKSRSWLWLTRLTWMVTVPTRNQVLLRSELPKCVCVKQRPLKDWLWAELCYNRHFILSNSIPLVQTKVVAVKENVPLISQMCWLGIQPWVILPLFMFCTSFALSQVSVHLSE